MFSYQRAFLLATGLMLGATVVSRSNAERIIQVEPSGVGAMTTTELLISVQEQIVDLTARLTRLEKLIEAAPQMKTEVTTEIKIFTLRYANAETAFNAIAPLFESQAGVPTVITCDARTNTILARGLKNELTLLEATLMRIDTEQPEKSAAKKGSF